MRLILDTNVLLAALLSPHGAPDTFRILNRRTQPDHDFSALPRELRIPLAAFFVE